MNHRPGMNGDANSQFIRTNWVSNVDFTWNSLGGDAYKVLDYYFQQSLIVVQRQSG